MDSIIRGMNVYFDDQKQTMRLDAGKLPTLSREMEKFMTGGGHFAFELPAELKPLEAEFDLNGNPEVVRSRFGREPGDWTNVTVYEVLLDVTKTVAGGAQRGRIVRMRGLFNEVTQPNVLGMQAKDKTKVKVSSIMLYHDIVDGKTIHKFDVLNNVLVINGINYTAKRNRLLAI